MFTAKYTRVRFHIEFGPPSLFERVLFKMKDVQKLYMDGAHFKKREHNWGQTYTFDIICFLQA